jgi:hypothetical protein
MKKAKISEAAIGQTVGFLFGSHYLKCKVAQHLRNGQTAVRTTDTGVLFTVRAIKEVDLLPEK